MNRSCCSDILQVAGQWDAEVHCKLLNQLVWRLTAEAGCLQNVVTCLQHSTAQHVVKLGTRDECFGTYEIYRTSGMKEGGVLPRPTE
jgi:hypothetical protein